MDLNKKEIKEELYLYIDLSSLLEGDLLTVSKNILELENRLKREHQLLINEPNRFSRFELKCDYSYDYGNTDRDTDIKIFGVRLETDEEYNKRIDKANKISESMKNAARTRISNKEKKERELYLKLKDKYKE